MFKILFIILIVALLFIPRKKASSFFTWLFFFATFLVMGMRHMYCYQDTYGYVQHYVNLRSLHWGQLTDTYDKDVIFWFFSKIVNYISKGDYTVWLLIISFFFIFSIYILVKKESSIPAISALVVVVIGMYYFAFTGLRQTLALAFIAFAVYFLLNKEPKWALIMVFSAAMFHITALIFLVVFPLCYLKLDKSAIFLYVAVGLVLFVLGANFSDYISSITLPDRFENYAEKGSSLSLTGFFIKLFLFVFSYFCLGEKRFESKNRILLHMAIIGLITQSLSSHLAEMFRISMYFSFSYVLLFANSIVEYKRRTGRVELPVLFTALLVGYLFIANNSIVNKDYFFFFDSPVGLIEDM